MSPNPRVLKAGYMHSYHPVFYNRLLGHPSLIRAQNLHIKLKPMDTTDAGSPPSPQKMTLEARLRSFRMSLLGRGPSVLVGVVIIPEKICPGKLWVGGGGAVFSCVVLAALELTTS